MRPRGLVLGGIAVAVAALLVAAVTLASRGELPTAPPSPVAAPIRANPNVSPFQGMGTWIDLYDVGSWKHPRRTIEDIAAHGVRTLYLQTSNFHRQSPFVFRDEVTRFVDLSHAEGLQVVAWYLPGFRDLPTDVRSSMAAIDLVTPAGHSFDGFALDIESSEVRSASRRTARLLRLSDRLRHRAGDRYPLGAIIPTPRRIDLTDPGYWPGFPYSALAETYDAILPMTYYTYRVQGAAAAHAYTSSVISLLRADVGNDDVPIHVIGGIASMSSDAETEAFVQAVREQDVIGASFYTFPLTNATEWPALQGIPFNLPAEGSPSASTQPSPPP